MNKQKNKNNTKSNKYLTNRKEERENRSNKGNWKEEDQIGGSE